MNRSTGMSFIPHIHLPFEYFSPNIRPPFPFASLKQFSYEVSEDTPSVLVFEGRIAITSTWYEGMQTLHRVGGENIFFDHASLVARCRQLGIKPPPYFENSGNTGIGYYIYHHPKNKLDDVLGIWHSYTGLKNITQDMYIHYGTYSMAYFAGEDGLLSQVCTVDVDGGILTYTYSCTVLYQECTIVLDFGDLIPGNTTWNYQESLTYNLVNNIETDLTERDESSLNTATFYESYFKDTGQYLGDADPFLFFSIS